MKSKIIEVTNGPRNWGKFMLISFDEAEWSLKSALPDTMNAPLLRQIGWNKDVIWVLDLQTCEGAAFLPGGLVQADLEKHSIWVCPMFEPFLGWLYQQKTFALNSLPDYVDLPNAPFAMRGYRRPGRRKK